MNQYHLIALDLDGTALDPANHVTSGLRDAVAEAHRMGCHVVISTGRICGEAAEFGEAMGADDLMVTSGGASVSNRRTCECEWRNSIDWERAVRAAAAVERIGLNAMIYIGTRLLLTPYCDLNFSKYKSNEGYLASKEVVPSCAEFIANNHLPIDKIFCRSTSPEMLDFVRKMLRTTSGLRIISSASDNVEIMSPDTNKARALAMVAAHYGTDLAHTIAIGDSENDREMLEAVGMPVAMGNATPAIKSLARYIAPTNAEDGAARAILELLHDERKDRR